MPSLRQTSATAASSRDKSVYIWSIGDSLASLQPLISHLALALEQLVKVVV